MFRSNEWDFNTRPIHDYWPSRFVKMYSNPFGFNCKLGFFILLYIGVLYF